MDSRYGMLYSVGASGVLEQAITVFCFSFSAKRHMLGEVVPGLLLPFIEQKKRFSI